MRREVLIAIVAMALATYATRIGGVLAGRGPLREVVTSERAQRWLRHLPGGVVISIVAPEVVAGGAPDVAAAALTLAVALRTRSAVATIVVGTLGAALLRRWLAA